MRRFALSLLLSLTALSLSAPAVADDADEADLEFQLGAERYKAGDYTLALEHFLASNRLAPNHNVVFNIARAYERLDRFSDAYKYYVSALSPENTAERRTAIEEALARIKPKIAVLEVVTDPPGATIYLNRKELGARGTAPRSLGLGAGTYTVIAELADHETVTSAATVLTVGTTTTLQLKLAPLLATVEIGGESASGAAVRVDDDKGPAACVAPCALKITPGHHTLYFARPGWVPIDLPVDVAPRATVTVHPKLTPLSGSVVIESDIKDSLIEIDGKPAGFAPAVLSLPLGEHEVRISHVGYRAHLEIVKVAVDAQVKLDVELTEALEVGAASRRIENVEDAPASISIIPKYELVGMGYPTIAEALRGVRGIYVDDDRSYQSLGIRGLGRPGEYGSHVLVLVDGHPTNENDSGGAAVGFDARTDLDDVERIEVVRGPGSALYGSSAFFGVINLVTHGRDRPTHVEAGMSAVEYGVLRGRLHATYKIDDDAGFWVSLSGARSPDGRDFTFAEFAVDGATGASIGNDGFNAGTLTGRAWWKTVTAQWLYTDRKKHIPTGVSDTGFPSRLTNYEDRHGFFELKIEPKLGDVLWTTRAHANVYLFDDKLDYAFDTGPTGAPTGGPYIDSFRGAWFGLEERFLIPVGKTLQLTAGAEGQYHALTRQHTETAAGEVLLSRNDPYTVGAGYVVADWTPSPVVKLSPAVRLDYYSTTGFSLNPRLAIVLHATPETTTKLLAGKAFRAPSIYALYYQSDRQRAPESLKPENVYSAELELSQRLSKVLTATVAGYASYVRDLIELTGGGSAADPSFYANSSQPILATGIEAEVRRDFRRWMFAAQMSVQRTRYLAPNGSDGHDPRLDHVGEVPNSPNVLGSLKASVPISQRTLVVTSRLTYVGPRWDRSDRAGDPPQQKIDGAAIWDLVFTGEAERLSLRYGIGIYNLMDTRWHSPISPEYRMKTMVQNGRTIYASLGVTL